MSPRFPECKVMRNAASQLRKNIKALLNQDAACQRNIHCTGVNCTWSGGGFLEVDLHHCDQVYYHILVNAPSHDIRNREKILKEGDRLQLYKNRLLGEISLKVVKLSRTDNVITTIVEWEVCLSVHTCKTQRIVDNTFCVKMESCPDFNASTTHYKPCHAAPEPTGFTSPHSKPEKRPTKEVPEPGNVDAQKGGKHQGDSSLSTAAIIGICAAGLIAILVVIGTVVYWKKYHHRSRLRAAYYNDISMHDPLYEDFGPEVA